MTPSQSSDKRLRSWVAAGGLEEVLASEITLMDFEDRFLSCIIDATASIAKRTN